MNIVIVGDGKVGAALTQQLSKEGHDITVIDNNAEVLTHSMELYDIMAVQGNGASLTVQKEANVGSSDLVIAATSADEINLLCCILAKKLGAPHTIARVRNPEYAEQLIFLKEELGLSMTINPERTSAREIFRILQFPTFIKRDSFAGGKVEIVELRISDKSKLHGKPLSELYKTVKVQVLVCAVERGGEVTIPTGAFVLQAGDKIYVTAATNLLADLIKNLGIIPQKTKSVIIVGGSRIAIYLALMLLHAGIRVKIVERDRATCLKLADLLPKAQIICGDGSQQTLLHSEGLEEADAIVTLTNIDEENLIISMYAHHLGVPKAITKVNRLEYVGVFKDMGIDSVISPKSLTANEIVRYVRAMENTTGSSALTLHRIANDQVEALEFLVTGCTRHLGESLAEISLKKGILVACISRPGKLIIPKGSDHFQKGDHIIVVTTADRVIGDINDIFED